VIDEPYLDGHPFPEVFVRYLLSGYTFAEAAAVSDQTQLWRSLAVGDPLYCPRRVSKVPVLDVTPPPAPNVQSLPSQAGSARFRLSLNTSSTPPDLVSVSGVYGRAPLLTQTVAATAPYRLQPEVSLGGLQSGGFYRALLSVQDPAGHTTPVPELLHMESNASEAAAVYAGSPNPSIPEFRVEFALKASAGVANVQGLALIVDIPSHGVVGLDLIPILGVLPYVLHGDAANGALASLEIIVPGGLPSGTYIFRISSTAPSLLATTTVVIP
jgi:hypothetical protein